MTTDTAPNHADSDKTAPSSFLPILALFLVFFISSWNTRERPLVLFAVPVLLVVFVRSLRRPVSGPSATAIVIAALALLGYDMLSPRAVGQGQPEGHMVDTYARVMNAVWIVFAGVVLYRIRKGLAVGWRWSVAIIGLAAVLSAGLIFVTPEPGIDVWHLHQEAGTTLFDGDNPYSDIAVFASTDEIVEEARLMTGYPYTPPNLFVFGGSAALTGDSRWFSLFCWLGFLALFAMLRPRSTVGTALVLFLASQPAWHVVLEIAYTETLTLLLLAASIVVWRKRETLGPILLGLTLATKQYFVVLAPMVLFAKLLPTKSRLIALGTAGLGAAVGLIWGAGDYIDAVVSYHLRVPPQSHSVSLYGLTYFFERPVLLPSAIGLVASIVIGVTSARSSRTRSQLLLGAAAALGTGFFLATQAYVNYWLLVGGILALAYLLADPPDVGTHQMNPEPAEEAFRG